MNQWVEGNPLQKIAMKSIHIMPSLLLQKPSKNLKAKDHLRVLERRLEMWNKGEIDDLYYEANAIQKNLKSVLGPTDVTAISKKFSKMMHNGNVNGAIKVLTNNMENGILPLNEETLTLLAQKLHDESNGYGRHYMAGSHATGSPDNLCRNR